MSAFNFDMNLSIIICSHNSGVKAEMLKVETLKVES
jgi:hypothetical protein